MLHDVVAQRPGDDTALLRAGRVFVSLPWSTIRARGEDLTVQRVELDAPVLDVPALQRYLRAMQGELGRIGLAPDFAAAMLAHRFDDLSAIEFTPAQAFDQTPGPNAGQPLRGKP